MSVITDANYMNSERIFALSRGVELSIIQTASRLTFGSCARAMRRANLPAKRSGREESGARLRRACDQKVSLLADYLAFYLLVRAILYVVLTNRIKANRKQTGGENQCHSVIKPNRVTNHRVTSFQWGYITVDFSQLLPDIEPVGFVSKLNGKLFGFISSLPHFSVISVFLLISLPFFTWFVAVVLRSNKGVIIYPSKIRSRDLAQFNLSTTMLGQQ